MAALRSVDEVAARVGAWAARLDEIVESTQSARPARPVGGLDRGGLTSGEWADIEHQIRDDPDRVFSRLTGGLSDEGHREAHEARRRAVSSAMAGRGDSPAVREAAERAGITAAFGVAAERSGEDGPVVWRRVLDDPGPARPVSGGGGPGLEGVRVRGRRRGQGREFVRGTVGPVADRALERRHELRLERARHSRPVGSGRAAARAGGGWWKWAAGVFVGMVVLGRCFGGGDGVSEPPVGFPDGAMCEYEDNPEAGTFPCPS
jgi:hypothetical protein